MIDFYKEEFTPDETAFLVSREAGAHLEDMARAAHALTARRFGKVIKLYAPIYISNECINSCLYCGFRGEGSIQRRTLSTEEAVAETRAVTSLGHRHVLLVAGESPTRMPLDRICEIAAAIRPLVASLAIEVQPFDEAGYRALIAAGVDNVTLYQETYDARTYAKMHPAGPKAAFGSRAVAIDAAGNAGMRFLNIGALLGLFDWRQEAIELISHARILMKRHWRSQIVVSVPRIRDCASGFIPPCPVSDRELAQLICALRLSLPDCGISLSTREPPALRDGMVRLGVTQMSAGSVTEPGGYSRPRNSAEQFQRHDTRTAAEVAEALKNIGYDPVWKDWDRNLI